MNKYSNFVALLMVRKLLKSQIIPKLWEWSIWIDYPVNIIYYTWISLICFILKFTIWKNDLL